MTDFQLMEFHAVKHAEAAVAARVWNLLSVRVVTEETTEFVKAFVSYTLAYHGKRFEDLTPSQRLAALDYQFDVCSGTTPTPETLEAIRGIYPVQ
jgi:hypothetical protein